MTTPESIPIRPPVLYFGTPVALITTLSPGGVANISPMSSAWALDDRIILGLGADGQCIANLERERQCVLNLPSAELWQRVERIARTTGRRDVPPDKRALGYRYDPDKFATAGLTPLRSDRVRAPRIAECPLQLEAEVMAVHRSSPAPEGPDDFFLIVEVRVLKVHAHREVILAGTNHVDTARWRPLLYVFRHYVSAGQDLGRTFKAEL